MSIQTWSRFANPAILLYLMHEDPSALPKVVSGEKLVAGLGWVVPKSVSLTPSQVLRFEAIDKKKEKEKIIDVPHSS